MPSTISAEAGDQSPSPAALHPLTQKNHDFPESRSSKENVRADGCASSLVDLVLNPLDRLKALGLLAYAISYHSAPAAASQDRAAAPAEVAWARGDPVRAGRVLTGSAHEYHPDQFPRMFCIRARIE